MAGRLPPPGYTAPPGYDDDDTGGDLATQNIGLLQDVDDPGRSSIAPPPPGHGGYGAPDAHRSYSYESYQQPPISEYSNLNQHGYGQPQQSYGYAASPSPSPTRNSGYPPYSPGPSQMDDRGWGGASGVSPGTSAWASPQMATPSRSHGWGQPGPSNSQYYEPDDDYDDPPPPPPQRLMSPTSTDPSSGFSAASSRRPLPRRPDYESRDSHGDTVVSMPYDTEDEESGYDYHDSRSSLRYGVHRRPMSSASENTYESDRTVGADDHDDVDDGDDAPAKPPATSTRTKGEHFGPAPNAPQARRGLNRQALMTRKQVKLINGELILDCKIPTILYSFLPRRDAMEFTHMRYTAVTCDPDDFIKRGYLLRQSLEPTRRETEMFICITMYNEDEQCFTRTMHGVMRNIASMCARSKSRVWGKDGWQKIVVCIVADGRKKVHPRVLDALAAMGVYQAGIAKNLVNGRQVQAHVYEYTTQVSLDSDLKFKGAEKGIVPVQILFCLKEQNKKKLNSHRWFFNAFGASLQPNVCVLLDVGTKPGPNSLYHLWKAFDTDSNVGGACGEIKAMKGKGWTGLFNPLVASQNFEYKMSNILDKPLESVFGYITVLPGALSAYRYFALQNDENGNGPLAQYFKGETLHGKDADVFTANMYLAEDRILCWELVAKKDERWVLKYVRSATGETDVPDAVPEFVSQRRRWLNGAFFAAIYSLTHFKQIWTTDHTVLRKVLLHAEFVYQFISLLFTFFGLANFYLMFYFVAGSLSDDRIDPFGHGWGGRFFIFLKFICILLICTQFILCMGNRPQGAARMFFGSMVLYAIIMAYTTFCSIYILVKTFTGGIGDQKPDLTVGDNLFTNLIISSGSTMGVYFLMSLLYMDPWHMATSSLQYFMMLPSYICTLQVYAFCNTHDVSWGTKGDNTVSVDLGAAVGNKNTVELEMPSEQLDIDSGYDEALRNLRDRLEVPSLPPTESQIKEDYYRAVRTYVVVVWMVANAVLAMTVAEIWDINDIGGNGYLKFTLWTIAVLAVYRMGGSMAYLVIQGLHAFVEGRGKLEMGKVTERFQPAWKRAVRRNGRRGVAKV